jgi:hypothetical protein
MKRSDISTKLKNAKHVAVEELLASERSTLLPHVWAARSHPQYNVVGVGIGRKRKGRRWTRTPCVRIYVEQKIARESLPDHFLIPEEFGGVETDVIETGRFRALMAAEPTSRKRWRPARPGCSIGFKFADSPAGELMAGTLGALVEANGIQYVLSNNHVLANENTLPIGTPIYQPGLQDRGDPVTDAIATLARFIALDTEGMNTVDCALAALNAPGMVRPTVLPKIGRLRSKEPIDAAEGMRVEKIGRGTGYTTGTIIDVAYTGPIQFAHGILKFKDQVLIHGDDGAFSDGGDSGALVVDRASGRATGLLFGGVPEYTMANHIGDVLSALNVKLVA